MAETYVAGTGGHVKLTAAITRPVAEWRLKRDARMAETTTSGSTSVRRKGILPDSQFTFNMPWDLDQTPESIGLRPGAELADIRFRLGNSGLRYGPFSGIVESIEIIVDVQKDVIRAQVSGYAQEIVPDPVPDV